MNGRTSTNPRRATCRAALAAAALLTLGGGAHAAFLPSSFAEYQPYPYCDSGSAVGLTFRPDSGGTDTLAFLVQTTFEEDIVWLNGCDVYTELARCCPTDSNSTHQQVVAGLAYNELVDCSGLDTIFHADGATGYQTYVYENDVFSTSDTSCEKCEGTGNGQEELACADDDDCSYIRKFYFDGLDVNDIVPALTVVEGFTDEVTWPDMLVVSVFNDSKIYFVDPSTSCTDGADLGQPEGSCALLDSSNDPIRPRGLAYGGTVSGTPTVPILYAAEGDMLYVVKVEDDGTDLTCEVIEEGSAPGDDIQGIAYDRGEQILYVADSDSQAIYFTEFGDCHPDCSAGGPITYACGGVELDPTVWTGCDVACQWTDVSCTFIDIHDPDQCDSIITFDGCVDGNACTIQLTVTDDAGFECESELLIFVDEWDDAPCTDCS